MSVWLCIPSARPIAEVNAVMDLWRLAGYKIALWRDEQDDVKADCLMWGKYPGYAVAANRLIRHVLAAHQDCDWVVTGGDDILPDPHRTADEIAEQLTAHFHGTMGVCQFTGDRWGDASGAYIDRVAGSPWIGREFARRAYQGKGPYWPEYTHQFVDEELQAVAVKLGVFWQRPDLMHFHQHALRPRPGEKLGQFQRLPEFLREANSPEHWRKYKALFTSRKSLGFPGHEPLASGGGVSGE